MDDPTPDAPDDHAVTLSFDAWAQLSARLMQRSPAARLEILEEADVEPHEWDASDRHYAVVLADEIVAGNLDRARAYGAACAKELAERPSEPVRDASTRDASEPKTLVDGALPLTTPTVAAAFQRDAPPVVAPPVAPPSQDVAGTAMSFEVPSALKARVLPFSPGSGSTAAVASSPNPPPPMGGVGETVPLGASLAEAAAAKPAIPFEATAPVFPRMPLATYAAFCAELGFFSTRRGDVLARYHVPSEVARAALDEHWQVRFNERADTKAEWQRLVTDHAERLRREQRP